MAGRKGGLRERSRRIAWAICLIAGFCMLPDTAGAFQKAGFVKGDVGDFPANWRARERAGKLVYTVREDAAGSFLHAESKSDSHTIGYPLSLELREYPFLRFAWRAVSLPPGGNEREKSTNDGALGIYVVFEGWSMPPRSIKYVWSTTLPVGTVAESPYSKKAKIVVLRSGSGGVGEWIDERVNVLQDFRRLFGEKEVPRVRGVGILTDSDNTASTSSGDYRSLRFSREEEEVASLAAP